MIAAVAEEAYNEVRAAAPVGVDVRLLAPGPLDVRALDGVEFLVPAWGSRDSLGLLGSLPDLRVVQILSAGTDWIEDLVPSGVTLCNARGARDIPMAEWVVGALLGAFTGLLSAARDRVWTDLRPVELFGARVVIVGHGSIGEATRARLEPLGVEVIGVARSPRDGVRSIDDLPALLPDADAVVLLTPLTESTRGMADAAFLGRMRDGALLVNGGRGAVVDTDALLREVESGRLRAVLDVTEPEPLPDDHPLWRAPGVLAISPHHAGDSAAADVRTAELAAKQLVRYVRGEPLLNVVG